MDSTFALAALILYYKLRYSAASSTDARLRGDWCDFVRLRNTAVKVNANGTVETLIVITMNTDAYANFHGPD